MTLPKSFRQLLGVPPSLVSASSGSTALIIIDAQGTYAPTGGLAISDFAASQSIISILVDKYRHAGAPVIWIQHSAGKGGPVFNPDDDASFGFVGAVRPKEGETVIVKEEVSSYTRTTLHETLEKLGTKQVVLTGYMAHVCVTTTARVASELGYDVVLVRDAIGDRDIPSADGRETVTAAKLVSTVLDELADAFGTVVGSVEVKA